MLRFSGFSMCQPPRLDVDEYVAVQVTYGPTDGSGLGWRTGDGNRNLVEFMFDRNGRTRQISLIDYDGLVNCCETPLPSRLSSEVSVRPVVSLSLWELGAADEPGTKMCEEQSLFNCDCFTNGIRMCFAKNGENAPIWAASGLVFFGLNEGLELAAIEIVGMSITSMKTVRNALKKSS